MWELPLVVASHLVAVAAKRNGMKVGRPLDHSAAIAKLRELANHGG